MLKIYRGELQNLANWPTELGKNCRRKPWSPGMTVATEVLLEHTLQRTQNTLAVLPVNLLIHPVLLASASHYIGYQLDNVLFTKLL